MGNRFAPNDTVMYGGHGACTLVEIAQRDFGGVLRDYYVLRPAFSGSSVFYVPTDSEALTARIHAISTAQEIRAAAAESTPAEWIEEDRKRQNTFKDAVENGGLRLLISAYKTLAQKQREYVAEGRKLRAADDRYMRDIERLLLEELSFAFSVAREQLLPFLCGEIALCEKEPV